jgi:orotate phosphoribosyltransferase-like protein
MSWAGHVARMVGKKTVRWVLMKKIRESGKVEDLVVNWRIIIKRFLEY